MKLHNQNYNQNPAAEVTSQTHNEHLKFGFLECEDSSAKTPVLSDILRYHMAYQLFPIGFIQHSRYDKVRVFNYMYIFHTCRDSMFHARTCTCTIPVCELCCTKDWTWNPMIRVRVGAVLNL
jgi:hypothetical protein